MRTIIAGLVAGIALILLTSAAPVKAPVRAPEYYKEKEIGQFPPHWGDLKGVAALQPTLYLIFQDGNGNVRRVAWNPTGVSPEVLVLTRKA